MRFSTFLRRQVQGDRAELLTFGPEHYRKAGVPYSPIGGMPVLEAYQIVNDLNREQRQFVYFLPA